MANVTPYGVDPEKDNAILRFPTGLTDSEEHQGLKKLMQLQLQALEPNFLLETNPRGVRLKCLPIPAVTSGFTTMLTAWITQLVMNPARNLPRQDIATDPKHYSLSVFSKGIVFVNIVPLTNTPDEEGFFLFSCGDAVIV